MMPILPSEALAAGGTGDPALQILLLLTRHRGPAIVDAELDQSVDAGLVHASDGQRAALLVVRLVQRAVRCWHCSVFRCCSNRHSPPATLALGWSALFVVFAALCIGIAYLNSKQPTRSNTAEVSEAT